ncbi:MAG: hypothetical protein QOD77_21 [Thermoplasmata archaeon]|jgi:transcription initiation factor IIE alpha subunit|nr:hypothetical protein [Thermoplasmata archaeon]
MPEYEFLRFPAEQVQVDPITLGKLPDSAQRVFGVVRERGPLTHTDLRQSTGMPARTIRFAVKRLKDEGLIDARCSLKDCRTCYFFVSPRHVGAPALEDNRRRAQEAIKAGKLIEHVQMAS